MDLADASWKKSSYSGGDEALCMEVASAHPGLIVIRDGKNPNGPALVVTSGEWTAFINRVKQNKR